MSFPPMKPISIGSDCLEICNESYRLPRLFLATLFPKKQVSSNDAKFQDETPP